MQMQDKYEPCYIFPSIKYTIDEEQDAVEVITHKILLKMLIDCGKDKTKKESLRDWWEEYVLSIKTQKQAAKEQAIITSIEMEHYANSIWQDLQQMPDQDDFTDGQELTPINSEQIDDEKSDEQSHQFIESVENENYVDDLS
jgi:hypothetical protein